MCVRNCVKLISFQHTVHFVSRVSDQNGISLQWYIVEIDHSGRKPSILIKRCAAWCFCISSDMFDQVLKFGSYIVDALREYQQPVLIYIPPYGELRGGSWVVVDPTINPDHMEMFADSLSRYVQISSWLAGCLMSQPHASVSQGRICTDNFMCCHTEMEVADLTFYLTQSQYTDTGPTSPSTDLQCQAPGRVATGVPIFKSLGWLDPEKSRCKRDSNPDLPLPRRTP